MIVLVSAVLGLFVLSQAVTFINHLAQSPVWVQWVGGAALTSALLAIVASTSMLVGRYLRLSQTPAVWLDRLRLRELAGSATIVLVNSYLLLAELCDIYPVRAGRLGTLRLLLRVGLNTAVSGNLDQQTAVLEDELRESIQDWTTGLVAQAIGKVVAKAAEGGANALLIYRVGRATIRELRPLRLT